MNIYMTISFYNIKEVLDFTFSFFLTLLSLSSSFIVFPFFFPPLHAFQLMTLWVEIKFGL